MKMISVLSLVVFCIISTGYDSVNSADIPQCGVSSTSRDKRIIGGATADDKSWPWMAYIRIQLSSPQDPPESWTYERCGATILNDYWLLTSAHCIVEDVTIDEIYIGRYSVELDTELEETTHHYVKLIPHDEFNVPSPSDPSFYANDIGLIKLREPIVFSDGTYVRPICLPTAGKSFAGAEGCYSAGWGNYDSDMHRPDLLKEVELRVLSSADCLSEKTEMSEDWIWSGHHLCVTGLQGVTSDTCNGDSGGPVMCPTTDGRWEQVGTVSWGLECAQDNSATVITQVSDYIDWIETKMAEN